MIRNIAHVEAYIDFSEDENIEDGVLEATQKDLKVLEHEIQRHLVDGRKGERLREGVKMAILGDTNVGKSSLMNLLVQRDVSIVTDISGTTRDVIESHYDINGYPVILADTAGIRDSNDVVESEGISRARKCASNSDLVIVVIDGGKIETEDFDEFRKCHLIRLGLDHLDEKKILTVVNKIDLASETVRKKLDNAGVLGISCTKLINIDNFLSQLTKDLKTLCGDPSSESPVLSHARHRHFLKECIDHIRGFLNDFDPSQEQDLAILVHNLRLSIRSIGRITGEVRTDDVLDVIFKDFCIGK